MSCGLIDIGGGADCQNLDPGGTVARMILFNYDDIRSYTEVDGVVTSITMRGGKVGYIFEGFRDDVSLSEEVLKPEIGVPQFKHNTGLVIYEMTQVQKNNIEKISRGRFVAIVENRGKKDYSFEIVGKSVGLELVPELIHDAHENGGFHVLQLSTPTDDGEYETKLPQQFGTNYQNTIDIIDDVTTGSGFDGIFDYTFDYTFE